MTAVSQAETVDVFDNLITGQSLRVVKNETLSGMIWIFNDPLRNEMKNETKKFYRIAVGASEH